MNKTIAYLGASADKQDFNNQKLEIYEFAKKNKLEVDEFIVMTISSRRNNKEHRIDQTHSILEGADTLNNSS